MRTLALPLLVSLCAVLAAGCGGSTQEQRDRGAATGSTTGGGRGSALGDDWGGDSKPSGKPTAREERTSPAPMMGPVPAASGAPAPPDAFRAATGEAMVGTEKGWRPAGGREQGPQPGVLTAGSFDDNLNPQFFHSFAGKQGQNANLGDLPGRFLGQRLLILVKNAQGAPVGNTRVHVAAPGAGPGVELTTRTDGRAVFLSSWDQVPADTGLAVTVTPPDGSPPVSATVARGLSHWEVTLPQAPASLPSNLDLALVLDTTGSMGDELEYLKSEIRSIAAAVHNKFPHVNQRYGLILYRDEGDEYVTRTFHFTPALGEFRKNLAAQRAGGGGDYPEAMHQALEEARQLQWRDGNTARVLFLVTDAPPHAQFMGRALAAADSLRKQGVAIYPVACSGYNDDAEFVLRACALLTGSQFLFLTDDSGVGNAHGEPHIPFYHVQKLDKLMTRMIESELAGRRIEPDPGDIVRTVGRPIN